MISAAACSAGDRPILAAPYSLSPVVCDALAAQGLIAGYIAERAPDTQEPEPLIGGWGTERAAGLMFLRQAASPSMLMLSAAAHHQLSGGLLLEARLKGVRRILFVAADGSIVKQVDVVSALVRMLQSVALANPAHQATYDELF